MAPESTVISTVVSLLRSITLARRARTIVIPMRRYPLSRLGARSSVTKQCLVPPYAARKLGHVSDRRSDGRTGRVMRASAILDLRLLSRTARQPSADAPGRARAAWRMPLLTFMATGSCPVADQPAYEPIRVPERAALTVLTTGANSGIGLATAIELARRGFRSVGSVRSREKAEIVAAAAARAGVAAETCMPDVPA